MNEVFDWYVGIDWASAVHGERAVRHTGEERAALAAWLIETTGAAPERIAVGIELPHGPVVSGDVRKSSLDDTRKGPPDDVTGVKDGRHGDNFSFL
jgi:hypothetical protein